MQTVDDYFIENSIDYDTVESELARLVHTDYMLVRDEIVFRQISIPDNSAYNYMLFMPPEDEQIAVIHNGIRSRVYTKQDITIIEEDDHTDLTTFDSEEQEDIYIGVHGSGILFQTEDNAREVVLKLSRTMKTVDNMNQDYKTIFKTAYFYLFNNNVPEVYGEIRKLSAEKENIKSERTREYQMPVRRSRGIITVQEL